MKTLTANITETLEDWFASHGLEIKRIAVSRKDSDEVRLKYAFGEFMPTQFDSRVCSFLYDQEIASKDPRFEGTVLTFTTDTNFEIE